MFKKILNKFSRISGKEHVIYPKMGNPTPKKEMRIKIFKAEKIDDFSDLRACMEKSPVVFVNVSAIMGSDLQSFVERIKIFSKQSSRIVCGLDKNWIIVSQSEIEKL